MFIDPTMGKQSYSSWRMQHKERGLSKLAVFIPSLPAEKTDECDTQVFRPSCSELICNAFVLLALLATVLLSSFLGLLFGYIFLWSLPNRYVNFEINIANILKITYAKMLFIIIRRHKHTKKY